MARAKYNVVNDASVSPQSPDPESAVEKEARKRSATKILATFELVDTNDKPVDLPMGARLKVTWVTRNLQEAADLILDGKQTWKLFAKIEVPPAA